MASRVVPSLPPLRKPKRYRLAKWIEEMLTTAAGIVDQSYATGRKFANIRTAHITAGRLRSRFPAYEFAARSGVIYCRRKPGVK